MDPFGNKIIELINEITGCTLTNNFLASTDLEHDVRAYELMRILPVDAIQIAERLLSNVQIPLKDYYEIVRDREAHNQVSNELAYTILLLINIPSRNLFVKTFDEELLSNRDSSFYHEYNTLSNVFCELAKIPKLSKCMLFYYELKKVYDAIADRLKPQV